MSCLLVCAVEAISLSLHDMEGWMEFISGERGPEGLWVCLWGVGGGAHCNGLAT